MADKRAAYLKKTYGLSPLTYLAMVSSSHGLCHICSRAPKTGKHHNIDHDHRTGEIRGLLCFFCNKYLVGRRRREHAHLFENAAKYLKRSPNWGFAPITTKIKKRKK